MTELTAPELATRLGVSRRRATTLLVNGRIEARQLPSGMWLADSDSVARFERLSPRGQGRKLSTDSAWGLLWELSGLDVTWLTPSTHARIRRRIRESSAEDLAVAVAPRTAARHFRTANAQNGASGLIYTARAASSHLADLGVDLMPDLRRISGYVRTGTAAEFAESHYMIAASDGLHVLFENTLPILYTETEMPAAVIAADLCRSTDTRERAAGLLALEKLRAQWLSQ